MNTGQQVPALGAGPNDSVRAIDGRAIEIAQLTREGPVVIVLLRGFS